MSIITSTLYGVQKMKPDNSTYDKTEALFIALKSAVTKEFELKKRLGQNVIIYRDGKVIEVSAEEALRTTSEAEPC